MVRNFERIEVAHYFFIQHAKFLYAIRPLPMGILEVF